MSDKFGTWAIVEVMGHQTYAGYVSEQTVAGGAFVRVDVPELPEAAGHYGQVLAAQPAFTKLFAPASIYCLTPCTQESAVAAASEMRPRTITCVDMVPRRLQAAAPPRPAEAAVDTPWNDDDGEGDYER